MSEQAKEAGSVLGIIMAQQASLDKSIEQTDSVIEAAQKAIDIAKKYQSLFLEACKLLAKAYPTSNSIETRNEIYQFIQKVNS